MNAEERGFIDALGSEAEADTARLVYADWLEEQGQGLRAEYLRLSVELPRLWEKARRDDAPTRSPHIEPIARTRIRLRDLCQAVPAEWLALVSRGKVEGCDFTSSTVSECPSRWENLSEGSNHLVRRCKVCIKDVRLCIALEDVTRQQRVVRLPCV